MGSVGACYSYLENQKYIDNLKIKCISKICKKRVNSQLFPNVKEKYIKKIK